MPVENQDQQLIDGLGHLRTGTPVENQDQQLIDDLDHFHIPEVQRERVAVACMVADTATPHAAFDI
jgi:hypothetical protein